MTSVLASDHSLYELVASSTSAPFAMQVSPVTFKALMSSLIDLLIHQNDSASVWLKLPKGDAWQLEFDRYLSRATTAQEIYCFKNQQENADAKERCEELAQSNGAPLSNSVQPPNSPQSPNSVQPSNSTQFPSNTQPPNSTQPYLSQSSTFFISPDSVLRREHFLVIWSRKFCGLLVGYRAKIAPTLREGEAVADDEGSDKKQPLTAFLVFDPIVVRQAIAILQPLTLASVALPDCEAVDSRSINQLFAKQVQRQEELWQRAATHRRQAEMMNLLQIQNEELLNTIRLKDEFLQNVGQELRTPLTNMKTALTLLNSPNLKPLQKQRYMDLLARECDRQSSLITSLLDLVTLDQMTEQSTIQALSLIDIVPGVVSTYQPLAEEKGIRLAYTIPENLPLIACLAMGLKKIVINLLHNGIKFTPRGGQVWVRAKQQGDYVQLEFRDTGIGIAAAEIPKIFDRFYRVRQAMEETTGGAGLGLTIVQKLLLHCGGSISVKSRVGEGTTFNVLLPIYPVHEEH